MLQEQLDLSLITAQIVQKLKGSSLYAQLERQAWVSEAEWEGMETGGAAAVPGVLHPANLSRGPHLVTPARYCARKILSSRCKVHSLSLASRVIDFLKKGGAHQAFLQARETLRLFICTVDLCRV